MKKGILNVLIILTLLFTKNVYAANYQIKELIPINEQTTVKGEYFLYKNISYDKGLIIIEKIINNSYEKRNLSVSIGLFDDNKLNIGTIILCDEEKQIDTKENVTNYKINIEKKYLSSTKTKKDIKYISIINDNETCRKKGFHDFLGKKVEDIGKINALEYDEDVNLLINVLKVVGVVLILLFVYNFIFTNKYKNIDNEDIRKSHKNKEKKEIKETKIEKQNNESKKEKIEENQVSLEDLYK